jgi:hypothetical protein
LFDGVIVDAMLLMELLNGVVFERVEVDEFDGIIDRLVMGQVIGWGKFRI